MGTVINILSVIAALILLSILVTVHELGHFSMGRILRFRIDEFAIGMGPKVYGKEKNGTLYSLRALPIGGMCRFYGEDEAADNALSFTAQKPWKRFLAVLAGPVTNLLFTIILSAIFLMAFGGFEYLPTVQSLSEDVTKAQEAGMLPGDVLYAVDGVVIEDAENTIELIRGAKNNAVITVLRNKEYIDLQFQDIYNEEQGYNLLGINLIMQRKTYGFFESIARAFPFVFDIIKETFKGIAGMFQNGVQQGDVMGVVGTVAMISYAVRSNFEIVMYFAIILSISLAIFNLLPIPALDGGRLVFIIIEMIRGKPIAPEKEGMVHLVGFILLMGLVLLITFSDIRMLIGR